MPQDKKGPTLVGMTEGDLVTFLEQFGEPPFRARQIYHWIYGRHIASIGDMKNIPISLREQLAGMANLHPLTRVTVTGAESASSRKYLFALSTGETVESVLIHEKDRITVCVSTQVGCAVDCVFCATAKMGFNKNLTAGEIVDQGLQIQQDLKKRITNIVFMGMGEPFLNYEQVIKAAELLNDSNGPNIGARKITISTAGIIPKIKRYSEEGHKYKLAISLNAASQEQRLAIMPITNPYPLKDLLRAAQSYYEETRNFITFEYVLLDRTNDTPGDARRLIRLIGSLPCKLNIIPYNEIDSDYKRPSQERIASFLTYLKEAPFTVTVRWSKGIDINAGCGQLATSEA